MARESEGFLDLAPKKYRKMAKKFGQGEEGKIHQISNLREDQEKLSEQLVNAGLLPGAGGAFGTAADYYRNLLSDNPADLAAFTAPALRQYNEEIVPGISEQFAGMGSGGLSSSGFRNAQIQGATDLSERLGAIRANLRQHGAQGLANIGQLGLQSFQTNYPQERTPGFFETIAPAVGTAIGAGIGGLVGGPAGAVAGGSVGSGVGGAVSGAGAAGAGAGTGFASPTASVASAPVGYGGGNLSKWYGGNAVGKNTSPYGASRGASPNIQQRMNFNLGGGY